MSGETYHHAAKELRHHHGSSMPDKWWECKQCGWWTRPKTRSGNPIVECGSCSASRPKPYASQKYPAEVKPPVKLASSPGATVVSSPAAASDGTEEEPDSAERSDAAESEDEAASESGASAV